VVDIAAEVPLEEFEDTKGVIRISISMKYRQHNDLKKKYKRTNNDPQNIHIKLKIGCLGCVLYHVVDITAQRLFVPV
jgi:hypothetical protein